MSSSGDASDAVLVETQTRHILLVTQTLFFLTLGWCLILNHSATAENDGISFYGVYHETVIFLVFGYATAFVGLWRTSTHFKEFGVPSLTWIGLRAIAVLLVVLLATPYNRGTLLNWAHMSAGILGAVFELEIALQLVRESHRLRTVIGLVVLLIGGGISAASLPDWHFEYLLQGQIIFQIGFSWCLIEWTYALATRTKTALSRVAD
ncbi:MAG: hypothetical protein ABSA07_09745 [Acidimicrobiales bacterium]|jgi:hypothetical protein